MPVEWSSLNPTPAPLHDTGIYPDLSGKVELRFPAWLGREPVDRVAWGEPGQAYAYLAGRAVAFVGQSPADVVVDSVAPQDTDRDGIPDPIDILIGGKKTVIAAAPYKETYRNIPYPNGDIPRDEGVCTDVVVRALRNAGIDLQRMIHEDALRRPGSYPGISHHDTSIDHRRVRNLVPWFQAFWDRLPTSPTDNSQPWLPGDIVFLDTMRDPQPDHLGIVSDQVGPSGLPLIINSWTTGYHTSEMDLLASVPVTHRFRVPAKPLASRPSDRGLSGLLVRLGIGIDPSHKQALLVTAATWESSLAELRRYDRQGDGWQLQGKKAVARLGASGLGRGRGMAALAPPNWALPTWKREGDKRSPAGVFLLGSAFGTTQPQVGWRWPYRPAVKGDVWVDDVDSAAYNTWQAVHDGGVGWKSAEDLTAYSLGLVLRHNDAPVESGAGSAIFLHSWEDLAAATVGCTGVQAVVLREILQWLDPSANPLIIQTAGWVWE